MSEERTARIVLPESLDVHTVHDFEALLPPPDSVERIVIDCSNTNTIDSTAVTALMRYRRRFQEAGNDPLNIVVIANAGIRRMFDIAGISRTITVLPAHENE